MAQAHLSSLNLKSDDSGEPSSGEEKEQHDDEDDEEDEEDEEKQQTASATCGGCFNTVSPIFLSQLDNFSKYSHNNIHLVPRSKRSE